MKDEIIKLKQQIEALAEIGIYTFPNGQIVKAVSVATPNYPPAGTVTQGLEVAIVPGVKMDLKPALNQGCFWNISHEIILKQWDEQKTTLDIIRPLTQLLLENNYSVNVGLRLIPNPKLGNIESRNLTIFKTIVTRRR
ncbi:hypothetical protein QT972_00210 [Microcoleus sp. herbarium7]|uniref:hypothetical protein n=1 Tax=Microcoleus sp. herbarium7 TaxID=3055435 RepID=UPI002FD52AFF